MCKGAHMGPYEAPGVKNGPPPQVRDPNLIHILGPQPYYGAGTGPLGSKVAL